MPVYSEEELQTALKTIASFINRSEKARMKFKEGSAHDSLLKNRIKALYISKALIEDELAQRLENGRFTAQELADALLPVDSLIHKNQAAQQKYAEGTAWYARFENNIRPMRIAKALIERTLR